MTDQPAIWWYLDYPDGRQHRPIVGAEEKLAAARPGASHLVITRHGEPFGAIELLPPKDRPVFYRARAIDLGGDSNGEAEGMWTVFGRSTPDGECDLWTLQRGVVVPCPPERFARSGVMQSLGV